MRSGLLLVGLIAVPLAASCATKYSDEDFGTPRDVDAAGGAGGDGGAGPLDPVCIEANLDCGPYGVCRSEAGEAVCVCDSEYSGELCDECADGYQDNDDDGSCEEDCGDRDCSGRGTCSDASGSAVCACDGLFAGPDCGGCTPGFELNGETCEWIGGLVENGSFDDESAWVTTGDAAIVTSGGLGRLSSDALCFGGSISQELVMPTASDAPPLLLRFKAWRVGSEFNGSMVVRLGDLVRPVDLPGAPPATPNNEFCLGPSSLGGPRTLSFQPGAFPTSCAFDNLQIDDVDIVLDEEGRCGTTPGLQNGTFETTESWGANGPALISGGSAYFESSSQCSAGSLFLEQPVIVPEDSTDGGPALRITFVTGTGTGSSPCNSGSCADAVFVQFREDSAETRIARLQSTALTTRTICIPPEWRGAATTLRLRVGQGGGGCASAFTLNSRIDEVEFVADEACRLTDGVSDGSFESEGELTSGWSVPDFGALPATKVTDAAAAPDGEKFLSLEMTACPRRVVETPFVTPAPNGDAGAAIRFRYRLPPPAEASLSFEACSLVGCETLTPSEDWTEGVLCVDPQRIGTGLPNTLGFAGRTMGCAAPYGAETLEVDDVRVGTDPSCD